MIAADVAGVALPFVGTLAALGAAGAILGWLAGRDRLSLEVSRKLAHLVSGLVALSFAWTFEDTWPVALLGGLALVLVVAARGAGPLQRIVGPVLHRVDRRSLGDACLPVVVPLLHGLAMPDRLLYVVPVLVLTLADAAAALIGVHLGRWDYRTDEGSKTVEGSIALAAVTTVVVAATLLAGGDDPARALAVAATIALLVMLAESASWRGLDNLVIPLATYVLLVTYRTMTLPALVHRLALIGAFVILAMVWHRRAGLIESAAMAVVLPLVAIWAVGGWSWGLPALALVAVLPFLGDRPARQFAAEPPGEGVGAVLALGGPPLAWVLLHANRPDTAMPWAYLAACGAVLGVIGAVRRRHDHRQGRSCRWLPLRIGVAAAATGPLTVLLEPSRLTAPGPWLGSLIALAALGLAFAATSVSPIERRPAGPEVRWIARCATVIVVSGAAFALAGEARAVR